MGTQPARSAPTAGRRSILFVFFPVFALLGVLSGVWALATPVFGSPDENAHVAKAVAQWHGELLPHRQADQRFPLYDLPAGYHYDPGTVCFAYDANKSAGCAPRYGISGAAEFADWVGGYNPLYYYAVGWPSVFLTGAHGVYAMRIVGGLLCSVMLAAAATAAWRGHRNRWLPIAGAFLGAPMSLFLMASVNPQAVEFSGAVLLVCCLLRILDDVDKGVPSNAPLWVGAAIGGAALAVARATGPLWVIVVVALAFTAVGWRTLPTCLRRPPAWIVIAVIAVAAIFSITWTLFTGSLSGQAQAGDAPLVGGSPLFAAWVMLRATPFFLESSLGVFGWQDTQLTPIVYTLAFAALAILGTFAIVALRRRERRILLISLLAAVLIPVLVQSASVSRTGIIWQGRYGLFLYLTVVVIAAWLLSRRTTVVDRLSGKVIAIVTGMMAIYGITAFALVLRRYVVGSSTVITAMFSAPQWRPPLGWPTLVGIDAVATLVLAALVIVVGVRRSRIEDLEG